MADSVRSESQPVEDDVGNGRPGEASSDTYFMDLAFAEAEKALHNGEVPVGCVLVRDGKVISSGCNATNACCDATRHAEMVAITRLYAKESKQRQMLDQVCCYVTLEPCIMCCSALIQLGCYRCVYGAGNDKFGGCGSVISLHSPSSLDPTEGAWPGLVCLPGLQAERAIELLRVFYARGNPKIPASQRKRPSAPINEGGNKRAVTSCDDTDLLAPK